MLNFCPDNAQKNEQEYRMRAIIPVAGVGTRLRPHTYTMPKVLLNVAGKPILGHILDKLVENGIEEVTIVVGYMGDLIKEYVTRKYSLKVDFVEQQERLGLGHAIYLSRHTVSREPVLIILGDTVFDFDMQAMITSPHSSLGVKKVEDPRRFGVAELNNGFISKLVEKPEQPKSNLAIVGIYYIRESQILIESLKDLIKSERRTKGEFQLTDALQIMLDKGVAMKPFPVEGWFDCGKPETVLETNRHLLDRADNHYALPGVTIIPPVFIAESATVTNSILGPYATVADGATVEHCIIRNSIVCDEASVREALLEDSIVGNNASIQGAFKRVNMGDSSELEFT